MENVKQGNTIEGSAPLSSHKVRWKQKAALFITGQTLSLFGSSLVQFAIIWYITLSTQSGATMTIATIFGFAPQVVISLFSGVWADRFNRKLLIIASDAVVAASTFVLAMFFLSGQRDLWMIYLVSAVRAVGSGIQTPAVNAFLPQIVPKEKLMRVGGINGSLQSVMFLLSPAAGGGILSIASIETTFFIDIITASCAIVIMLLLRVKPHEKALTQQKGGYFDDLKNGVQYVWHSGFFRTFFLFFALFMFFLVPAAQLTPLMVSRTFGNEYWRLSLTEVMWSAGSVVGGIIISIWGGFKNRVRTIALSFILFGVATAALGLINGFVLFQIVMLLAGVTMPLTTTPAMTLMQEQVDPNMQGRIFSLVQVVMTALVPLGMIVFGPLADQIPIEWLFIGTGIVVAILGIAIIFNKHFKTGLIDSGKTAQIEQPAAPELPSQFEFAQQLQNPWQQISLWDYTQHMEQAGQLKLLSLITKDQLHAASEQLGHPPKVGVLGITHGNGLIHCEEEGITQVIGVDINANYLRACRQLYNDKIPQLWLYCMDVLQQPEQVGALFQSTDLLICNLMIEHIGLHAFLQMLQGLEHRVPVISCTVQCSNGQDVLAKTWNHTTFEPLMRSMHEMPPETLIHVMQRNGYLCTQQQDYPLPDGRTLTRLDFIVK